MVTDIFIIRWNMWNVDAASEYLTHCLTEWSMRGWNGWYDMHGVGVDTLLTFHLCLIEFCKLLHLFRVVQMSPNWIMTMLWYGVWIEGYEKGKLSSTQFADVLIKNVLKKKLLNLLESGSDKVVGIN